MYEFKDILKLKTTNKVKFYICVKIHLCDFYTTYRIYICVKTFE